MFLRVCHFHLRVCVSVWLCVRETAVSRVPGVALFISGRVRAAGIE